MKEPYQLLEAELAAWIGCTSEQVVACASGTAALHLALESLRLPPGSQVITGDFNMVAVPRAIKLAGLGPVFVDCDERLLMDMELIPGARLSPSAVLAVHIYGRRADMERLWELTYEGQRARTVEDMAELHGVKPDKHSDAAAYSFFRNKVVNCRDGEGGCVYFKDADHAALARQLRSLGFTDAHDFMHTPRGINARMSNLHAQPIRESLKDFLTSITDRREIEGWYDALCPDAWRMPPRLSPWIFDVRVPGMTWIKQEKLVRALQAEGVAARHSFKPMSCQDEFRDCKRFGRNTAYIASREVFYLPLTPGITRETAERSFDIIARTVESW